jgi:hypothetical protein
VDEVFPHGIEVEPAELPVMRVLILAVVPGAAQQPFGEAPVVDVGHAYQHDPVRAEGLGVAVEHCPGIAQMLQDFIVDDAVDAVGQVERQRIGFHVHGGDLVQMCRQGGLGGIDIDAEQAGLRVQRPVGGGECPAAAAYVQDRACRQGNTRQEVGSMGRKQHRRICNPAWENGAARPRSDDRCKLVGGIVVRLQV